MPKTYTIKPLEWVENLPEEHSYFVYPLRELGEIYEVYRYAQNDGDFIWQMNYDRNREGVYFSEEAAKQAAQSHWEERLKGALREVGG